MECLVKCVEPRFLDLETFHPVVLTNGERRNSLELDIIKLMSLSPMLKEIILGLQIPLSWIEDVKVVVPDVEFETISFLSAMLELTTNVGVDVNVSNIQFDNLLDLINSLGFDYFPSVCVTSSSSSDLIEMEHLYFKKIEDELQDSESEMVIGSGFYTGYEEFNNNEDETVPNKISLIKTKTENIETVETPSVSLDENGLQKKKKKTRRIRCGTCTNCFLNKETPRCGLCSNCLNPSWHQACKEKLCCLNMKSIQLNQFKRDYAQNT